jgi:hypothetical protein
MKKQQQQQQQQCEHIDVATMLSFDIQGIARLCTGVGR